MMHGLEVKFHSPTILVRAVTIGVMVRAFKISARYPGKGDQER